MERDEIVQVLKEVREGLAEIRRLFKASPEQAPSALLTFDEAARELKVSSRTVQRAVKAGHMLTCQMMGCVRIPASEIARLKTPTEAKSLSRMKAAPSAHRSQGAERKAAKTEAEKIREARAARRKRQA
jgi:excisionase family DNA binding protein